MNLGVETAVTGNLAEFDANVSAFSDESWGGDPSTTVPLPSSIGQCFSIL